METVQLQSGLTLAYEECGAREGQPLLYFHGFPGSRLEAELLDNAAQTNNIRAIATDRFGYGDSSFKPDRSLLDWPDTVREFADSLGLDKFLLLGISGGAPYALACAHALPDRVMRTGVICGLGEFNVPETMKALRPRIRWGLKLARNWPRFASWFYRFLARHVFMRWPSLMLSYLSKNSCPKDHQVFARQETSDIFLNSLQLAFKQHAVGAITDLQIYTHDWGFPLQDIKGEVIFWHGKRDRTVPHEFSEYAAQRVPNATLHLYDDDGHFSMPVLHVNHILAELKNGKQNW